MPEAAHLTVPRYVYKSVERALSTARQRIRVATERAEQLENTLASMQVGKNGSGGKAAVNDNEPKVEAEE